MKTYLRLFLFSGIVLYSTGCENDSENDLVDIEPNVNAVTYTDDVKKIIDTNCIFCHNDPPINFAPMPLLTFEQVKEAANNRGLIDRVSSNDISFLMPAGGPRLPQATIDIIIQWQDDGLIE